MSTRAIQLVSLTAIGCAGVACGTTKAPTAEMAIAAKAGCGGQDLNDFYYPADALLGTSEADRQLRTDASRVLRAMGEVSLSCGNQSESYRLLWFHAFPNRKPTMVRLYRSERWAVTAIQLAGLTDLRVRQVVKQEDVENNEAKQFETALSTFRFWQRPTTIHHEAAQILGGGVVILEGRRANGYRVFASRWPSDAAEMKPVCQIMLQIAGLTFDDME
ncbi:MAG TPA: hypothetical protein VJV74_00545 [Terriglobia bacterium]|nr:hypothetical protein [Terriglobia bacterium]